jgi:hypothetical protein
MNKTLATAITTLALSASASADLVDGSFEGNDIYYGYGFLQGGIDTPWRTTAPDNLIEIWGEYMPTPAYEGTRHAELNANYASTLYQDVNGLGDNNTINWHFAHRGRYGTDTMKLTITDLGADQLWEAAMTRHYSNKTSQPMTRHGKYTMAQLLLLVTILVLLLKP